MPAKSRVQQQVMGISAQYIAGFLDADGHISLVARNRSTGYVSYGLFVGFTNRDIRPLLHIKEIYGGNIYAKKRRSPKHSIAYELSIGNRDAVRRLLIDILPYIIIKREQAELGMSFLRLGKVKKIIVGRRKIHPTKGGTIPLCIAAPGEQDTREAMKMKINALNARGPQNAGSKQSAKAGHGHRPPRAGEALQAQPGA